MRFSTVSEWLSWIATLHTKSMDLSVDRIKIVASRLAVLMPECPVITVGGTNGKGSTVAGLETIYREAGYQVGAFTSPMLFKPNEQVRINGEVVSDDELCHAFQCVREALQDITLTPFEFFTLAALVIFKKYPLQVWILEVGLGGRLDAVNIINADVAVVTTIALDHMEWLGDTREKIGFEKAGIFRANQPAVCGDFNPPQSLINYAEAIHAPLYCQGKAFSYEEAETTWSWRFLDKLRKVEVILDSLPYNALATQNMSTVLMAITLLQKKLPVSLEIIRKGLKNIFLKGRIQIIPGEVTQIFDVAHNPAAIALLTQVLSLPSSLAKSVKQPIDRRKKILAVFSMLADKDIVESLHVIKEEIDVWYVAPLSDKRTATKKQLADAFKKANIKAVIFFPSIAKAYQQALQDAKAGDCVVTFGSFHVLKDCAAACF